MELKMPETERCGSSETLDCGHPVSDHSSITTGWGVDSEGKRHCYPCCLARDLEAMKTAQHYTAYLVQLAPPATVGTFDRLGRFALQNWPGGHLANVTGIRKTRAGFGGERWYFWAIDANGAKWHGSSPGPGMYATLHRSKAR